MTSKEFNLLSEVGEKIKLSMTVEVIDKSKRGFRVMLPNGYMIWVEAKHINEGKIQVEE